MGKSSPPPPAPPDYAAANRTAIETDISTLPLRRRIEAEARLGQGNFEGLGDADLAAQMFQQQLRFAPEAAQGLLDLQRQYGLDFVNEARRQSAAFDPEGFRLRQQFGDRLLNEGSRLEDLAAQLQVPDYERVTDAPQLVQDSAGAADIRERLERQVADELAMGNNLEPGLARMAEQAARARGAASGNILGDASALREALSVQRAGQERGDQRRAMAGAFLGSGQSVGDRKNMIGQGNFSNSLNAINQRNQATQNKFAAQQSNVAARQSGRQTDLANIQSFLGLQPISAQAGYNQNAQSGAAPFMQNGYNGVNLDRNAGQAGAQFAQGVFGTQANIYGTQSQNARANSPLAMLGQIGNIASSFGNAYQSFGSCHVAREVYGEDNPKWFDFYLWKEAFAPAWFRKAYNAFSKEVAALIRPFPAIKAAIRGWMDTKTQGA